jgi:beta-glucanase (GH16 family)
MPDLTSYKLVFDQTFNNPQGVLSIPPGQGWGAGSGETTWTCHTPYAGDFGSSWFSGPADGNSVGPDGKVISPFSIDPVTGQLGIKAWWDSSRSHMRSGLLSSMDKGSKGFAIANGYFEAKFKCPEMKGVWPAFWLSGANGIARPRTTNAAEIDIIEAYGIDLTKYHQHVHDWAVDGSQPVNLDHMSVGLPDLGQGSHTFGCLVATDLIHFYFDGVEQWNTPNYASAQLPLFMMINLAMGSGFPLDDLWSGGYPATMIVDYVRAYSQDPSSFTTPFGLPSGGVTMNSTYSDKSITGFSGTVWNQPGQVSAVFSAATVGNARLSFWASNIKTVTLVDMVAKTSRVLNSTEWTQWDSGTEVVVVSVPVKTTPQAFIAQ